jgi:diaminopropionate ammonia-lyase
MTGAARAIAASWLRSAPLAGAEVTGALTTAAADRAIAALTGLPDYAPTPLRELRDVAYGTWLAQVWLKDEGSRFGAGSFKALGSAHAMACALERGADPAATTVVCATDGNHGRAVAWAARRFGMSAVVFMPDHALDIRINRIRALGAEVRLVAGNYDEAVRTATRMAHECGWLLLSDTSDDPEDTGTLDVMSGYAVMVEEVLTQVGRLPPTHVFLQAGVGTFAAAVIAQFVRRLGAAAPRFVIVEPAAAACVLLSLQADAASDVTGSYATIMDCLAAGRVSAPAWPILRAHSSAALALNDDWVGHVAATAGLGVRPSGLAGLAGLLAAAHDAALRRALLLDERSRVLVFGTEERVD